MSLSQEFPLAVKLKKFSHRGMSHFVLPLPLYLFIFAEWLFSAGTLLFFCILPSLCSLLWSAVFSICFLLVQWPLRSYESTCGKKNIQPLGYIASFMWGPVVTLKACYVVCRFASAQLLLSVLGTLVFARFSTWSLPGWKALADVEAARPHLPAVLLRTYAACLEIAKAPLPAVVGRCKTTEV